MNDTASQLVEWAGERGMKVKFSFLRSKRRFGCVVSTTWDDQGGMYLSDVKMGEGSGTTAVEAMTRALSEAKVEWEAADE